MSYIEIINPGSIVVCIPRGGNAKFIRIEIYRYVSTSLKIFNFLIKCNSIVCDITMLASRQIYIIHIVD